MSTNGKTRFFYNASFSTQPQLQMLLNTYQHYPNETLFIFTNYICVNI